MTQDRAARPTDDRDKPRHRLALAAGLAFGGLLALATLAAYAVLLLGGARLFSIPSGSNVPNLRVGDYAICLCYDSTCRPWPLPLPFEINFGDPQPGDMAVFRKPSEPSIDYVKRIIGMPGDEVQLKDAVVYINGKPLPRKRIADFIDRDFDGKPLSVQQYEETLPNGARYDILLRPPGNELENTGVFKVQPGHYFVLGDNRDNSSDSRDPDGGVGFVPRVNMVAKARWVIFSTSQFGRIFVPVDLASMPGG